ncbi:ATP synthase F1 subunit gamma [Candidatus Saccharibacteria bacterium]|nr:ATP synthase F1 subunit gamma [Candidatus Saccharibacteria bacterium]
MPATRAIRDRIGSVKNTRQITRAMELVAASNLRRAQEAAGATREYAATARELLAHLNAAGDAERQPLYAERAVKSRLYIVVSSDQGLAGAYNSNLLKLLTVRLRADKHDGIASSLITLGRQAGNFAARLAGVTVDGAHTDLPDAPDQNFLQPIIGSAVRQFLDGEYDAVDIIYTNYVSTVSQEPVAIRLLPAGFDDVEVPASLQQATFEPSAEEVLETITIRLLESQLLQAMLSAKASEYMMRMMAMHNATDNANGLIDDLTLEMNKARQAYITQELAEITGGAEAMK